MNVNLADTEGIKPAANIKPYSPEIKRFLALWEKDPKSRVFAPLAETLRREGYLDKAIDVCINGLKIHPNYVSGRVALGRALFDRGDLGEAKRHLQLVFEADPENLVAAHTLGKIYEAEGELDKALLCYKLALYSSPGATEIKQRIETIEGLLGHLAQELKPPEAADKAEEKPPKFIKKKAVGKPGRRQVESKKQEPKPAAWPKKPAEEVETPPQGVLDDLESERARLSGKVFKRKERKILWHDQIERLTDKFFAGAEDLDKLSEASDEKAMRIKMRKGSNSGKRDLGLRYAYITRAIGVYEEFRESEPKNLQALVRLDELKKQAKMLEQELERKDEGDDGITEGSQEIIINLKGWLKKIREVDIENGV